MVPLVKEAGRADARRNRLRILEAARIEFTDAGAGAQMDDIAARAGVGVGTIYRHFPTKEALMGELVRERFLAFTEHARVARDGEGPAFERLATALHANCELMADDVGTQHAIMGAGDAAWERAEDARLELVETTRPVVAEAQAEGTLRADFDVEEIGMLMCGVCSSMSRSGPAAVEGGWRRHLQIVLDGLRAPGTR